MQIGEGFTCFPEKARGQIVLTRGGKSLERRERRVLFRREQGFIKVPEKKRSGRNKQLVGQGKKKKHEGGPDGSKKNKKDKKSPNPGALRRKMRVGADQGKLTLPKKGDEFLKQSGIWGFS